MAVCVAGETQTAASARRAPFASTARSGISRLTVAAESSRKSVATGQSTSRIAQQQAARSLPVSLMSAIIDSCAPSVAGNMRSTCYPKALTNSPMARTISGTTTRYCQTSSRCVITRKRNREAAGNRATECLMSTDAVRAAYDG